MTIHDLDTPALLIDLDVMERNLRRMADYAASHGLALRPHTKTHKTPALGRRQLDLGAVGLTVAKPGEAEVMLQAAPAEILVAYPTLGSRKLDRLMAVARQTRLMMSLDSIEVAEALSAATAAAKVEVGVLTEFDAGLHRVGVAPGPELDALIARVKTLPGLRWEGLAFYPGQVKSLDEAGQAELRRVGELVSRLAERHRPRIVSGGSTPAWAHSHQMPGLNEIRPGTYIFNDRNSAEIGSCAWQDCAASVLTTIVSRAVPGQAIIDGGSKTFSSDRVVTGAEGFGVVTNGPAEFLKMNEEHGFVRTAEPWRVGDRLRIIPNHVCVAVNLHERLYGVRGETVEEVWEVAARGKLQ